MARAASAMSFGRQTSDAWAFTPRYQIAGNEARTVAWLTERRHTGCMATPQALNRMSDWFSAHGRELRESAEKARERSIALRTSAEAERDRAVVLNQSRPTEGRRGFRMPWRF
jgi:hypothetical protein